MAAEAYDAERAIPVRRDSHVNKDLHMRKDFIVSGSPRLVELFKGLVSAK